MPGTQGGLAEGGIELSEEKPALGAQGEKLNGQNQAPPSSGGGTAYSVTGRLKEWQGNPEPQ